MPHSRLKQRLALAVNNEVKRAVGLSVAVLITIAISFHASRAELVRTAAAKRLLNDGVLRVVVIGNSVAHGAGDESGRGIEGSLDRELRNRGVRFAPAVNYGIDGARTFHALRLLRNAPLVAAADAVIVSIGGNDLYGDSFARLQSMLSPGTAMNRTIGSVTTLVHRIHALNPAARIILLGLYNPYRRSAIASFLDRQVNTWDSRLIARFAADRNVTVVRIVDLLQSADRLSSIDHFHPSALGYSLIAARVAAML